jgi:hypothetical protein
LEYDLPLGFFYDGVRNRLVNLGHILQIALEVIEHVIQTVLEFFDDRFLGFFRDRSL